MSSFAHTIRNYLEEFKIPIEIENNHDYLSNLKTETVLFTTHLFIPLSGLFSRSASFTLDTQQTGGLLAFKTQFLLYIFIFLYGWSKTLRTDI